MGCWRRFWFFGYDTHRKKYTNYRQTSTVIHFLPNMVLHWFLALVHVKTLAREFDKVILIDKSISSEILT